MKLWYHLPLFHFYSTKKRNLAFIRGLLLLRLLIPFVGWTRCILTWSIRGLIHTIPLFWKSSHENGEMFQVKPASPPPPVLQHCLSSICHCAYLSASPHSAPEKDWILIDLIWLALAIFHSYIRNPPLLPPPRLTPFTSLPLYPPSALTYMVVTWPRLPGLSFYGKSAGDKATGFKVLSPPVLWEGLNTEWGVIASMQLDTRRQQRGYLGPFLSLFLLLLLLPPSVWLDLLECHHCDFGGFLFPWHCLCMLAWVIYLTCPENGLWSTAYCHV